MAESVVNATHHPQAQCTARFRSRDVQNVVPAGESAWKRASWKKGIKSMGWARQSPAAIWTSWRKRFDWRIALSVYFEFSNLQILLLKDLENK